MQYSLPAYPEWLDTSWPPPCALNSGPLTAERSADVPAMCCEAPSCWELWHPPLAHSASEACNHECACGCAAGQPALREGGDGHVGRHGAAFPLRWHLGADSGRCRSTSAVPSADRGALQRTPTPGIYTKQFSRGFCFVFIGIVFDVEALHLLTHASCLWCTASDVANAAVFMTCCSFAS